MRTEVQSFNEIINIKYNIVLHNFFSFSSLLSSSLANLSSSFSSFNSNLMQRRFQFSFFHPVLNEKKEEEEMYLWIIYKWMPCGGHIGIMSTYIKIVLFMTSSCSTIEQFWILIFSTVQFHYKNALCEEHEEQKRAKKKRKKTSQIVRSRWKTADKLNLSLYSGEMRMGEMRTFHSWFSCSGRLLRHSFVSS